MCVYSKFQNTYTYSLHVQFTMYRGLCGSGLFNFVLGSIQILFLCSVHAHACADRWMDGRTDGWMDRQMDG